jgi:peroxiredoxin
VAAVTQGDPGEAGALCDRLHIPFPCLADPGFDAYRAFGLRRGNLLQLVGPSTAPRYFEAMLKGHRAERPRGDVMMLGATFIIDTGGVIRYARYARNAGDHPPVIELVEAIRRL